MIEVVTETNADWWAGRNRSGKQGLFPSNYVEKLPPRSLSPILVPEPRKSMTFVHSKGSVVQPYSSPALPHPSPLAPPHAHYPPPAGYYPPAGPPPGAANYSYEPPAGAPTSQPVAQQAAGKKSKFGGLGQVVSVVGWWLDVNVTNIIRWRNLQLVGQGSVLVSAVWESGEPD